MVGEWLGLTELRAYLTGPLCLESGERLLAETALPGPQGRHLLGFLIAEHPRPLSRDELADQLWPTALPAAWENSLKSLISKIRAALMHAGLPGTELIRNAFGAYQFRLPRDGWVDVHAATLSVHLAEAALAAGDLGTAARHAYVTRLITARPFLARRGRRMGARVAVQAGGSPHPCGRMHGQRATPARPDHRGHPQRATRPRT
jgi:hypothetical protein